MFSKVSWPEILIFPTQPCHGVDQRKAVDWCSQDQEQWHCQGFHKKPHPIKFSQSYNLESRCNLVRNCPFLQWSFTAPCWLRMPFRWSMLYRKFIKPWKCHDTYCWNLDPSGNAPTTFLIPILAYFIVQAALKDYKVKQEKAAAN